jgi:hypothetical protein
MTQYLTPGLLLDQSLVGRHHKQHPRNVKKARNGEEEEKQEPEGIEEITQEHHLLLPKFASNCHFCPT